MEKKKENEKLNDLEETDPLPAKNYRSGLMPPWSSNWTESLGPASNKTQEQRQLCHRDPEAPRSRLRKIPQDKQMAREKKTVERTD